MKFYQLYLKTLLPNLLQISLIPSKFLKLNKVMEKVVNLSI